MRIECCKIDWEIHKPPLVPDALAPSHSHTKGLFLAGINKLLIHIPTM